MSLSNERVVVVGTVWWSVIESFTRIVSINELWNTVVQFRDGMSAMLLPSTMVVGIGLDSSRLGIVSLSPLHKKGDASKVWPELHRVRVVRDAFDEPWVITLSARSFQGDVGHFAPKCDASGWLVIDSSCAFSDPMYFESWPAHFLEVALADAYLYVKLLGDVTILLPVRIVRTLSTLCLYREHQMV